MTTRTLLLAAAAVAVAGGASAQELRLLNSFDQRYVGNVLVVNKLIENVEKATGGKVKIKVHGPEVVPPFEQFQPASSGAFDMLFTVQPYHVGTTSVSLGVYALTPDPAGWRKNGVFEYVDKEYRRFNLRLLAIHSNTKPGVGAYQAVLTKPIGPSGDLQGRKVRANPLYKPMVEALGGSMVVLAGGEIYPALQKGTVEGAFWPVSGALDFKWYEVAKYMMRPTFGYSYHFMLIHENAWSKLSPEQQKALASEAEKSEIWGMEALDANQAKEIAELKKQGMIETALDPKKAEEGIRIFNEGIWKTAEGARATGDRAKAFHEFAKSKGLTK